jgi:hypothetical protein
MTLACLSGPDRRRVSLILGGRRPAILNVGPIDGGVEPTS